MVSMKWRSFSNLAITLALTGALSGCTSVGGLFWGRTDSPNEQQAKDERAVAKEQRLQETINSKFEWAIQNYEAGRYQEAIKGFASVNRDQARVERFQLIPWYLGMSHFHLGKFSEATSHLRSFLQQNPPPGPEAQEARITLLRILESREEWSAITTLAAETDQLPLYQQNRALVKLFWAEALFQQREFAGARKATADAEVILSSLPHTTGGDDHFDPRRGLWSRLRWLTLALEGHGCSDLTVTRTGKKAHLEQWVDGYGECLLHNVKSYLVEIPQLPARWAAKTNAHMLRSFEVFRERVEGELRSQKPPLARQQAVTAASKKTFFRALDELNSSRKNFENQPDIQSTLSDLSRGLEGLLDRISLPSSH